MVSSGEVDLIAMTMTKLVAKFDRSIRPRRKNVTIGSLAQLKRMLLSLKGRKNDPVIFLENEAGDGLTVAVMDPYATIVFRPADRNGPSMSPTTARKIKDWNQYASSELIEFRFGGVPSPVPVDWCISIRKMIAVVVHFYRTGKRLKSVKWRVN